ncbi:MAG: hypothetical protein RLZ14_317 [Actinomycetota bacterium]
MRLTADDALARLAGHDHGVLSTLHPDRGVDAVPCVYAVTADGFLGIPIDTVKPKSSTRLQRTLNLAFDPRATLLADHWDRHDWSRLWWVRVELRWQPEPPADVVATLTELLTQRYAQYENAPFAELLVLQVQAISGWAAT